MRMHTFRQIFALLLMLTLCGTGIYTGLHLLEIQHVWIIDQMRSIPNYTVQVTVALASIELLMEGLSTLQPEQQHELVRSLERGTLRLTRLIDNLLESVRIEGRDGCADVLQVLFALLGGDDDLGQFVLGAGVDSLLGPGGRQASRRADDREGQGRTARYSWTH